MTVANRSVDGRRALLITVAALACICTGSCSATQAYDPARRGERTSPHASDVSSGEPSGAGQPTRADTGPAESTPPQADEHDTGSSSTRRPAGESDAESPTYDEHLDRKPAHPNASWIFEELADEVSGEVVRTSGVTTTDWFVVVGEASTPESRAEKARADAEMDETCEKHPESDICFDIRECRPVYVATARRVDGEWQARHATRLGDLWCALAIESLSLADQDGDGRPEADLSLRHTDQNYAQTERTWRFIVDAQSGTVQFERIVRVPIAYEPSDWQTTTRFELVDRDDDGHPDIVFESAEHSNCDVDDDGWPHDDTNSDTGSNSDTDTDFEEYEDSDDGYGCQLEVEEAVLYYDVDDDVWAASGEW